MSLFSYTARDTRGELVSGTIDADSMVSASRALRSEGKFVINVSPGLLGGEKSYDLEGFRTAESAKRVKRQEVIDFCHQLSVMLDTGVPLSQALEAANRQGLSSDFGRVVRAVSDEVHNGASLSSALERWPKVFPVLVVSLVEASEASGTMGLMLSRVSKYLSQEFKTTKQIKGAMAYPMVMMLLSLVISVFLMTFVLPRFASIYESRSAVLPLPTRILMALSHLFTDQWLPLAIVSGVVVVSAVIFFKQTIGHRFLDWLRLTIPVIRVMYRKLYLARTTRTLSTLLVSGVELLEAIRITRGVTGNVFFAEMWVGVTEDLEDGKNLSDALEQSDLIPPNVIQMISAAEHSGRLGPVMEKIGVVADSELEDAVTQTTQYIEPVMIGFMGGLIGFVAISLLLPIFTISKIMQ